MPIYIKFESIKGQVTAEGYDDHVAADSAQWGIGRAIATPVGQAENREAGKPSVSEFTFSKPMEAIDVDMINNTCLKETGETVEVKFLRTQENKLTVYASFKLYNTLFASYSLSSGGDNPSVSFSLNFTKVEWSFLPREIEGGDGDPVKGSYDLAKAVK